MKTTDIIKAVVSLIKPVCTSVYFGNSPVKFPKIDCDLRQVNGSENMATFRLVLDIWTNDGNYIETQELADSVKKALTFQKGIVDGGFLSVYESGTRYFAPENKNGQKSDNNNNKIMHLSDAYELYFYKGEED